MLDGSIVSHTIVFSYVLNARKKLYHLLFANVGFPVISIDFSFSLDAFFTVFLSVIISTVIFFSALDSISLINFRGLKWFS